MITRLAEAGQDGRLLVVNTTNVDNGDSRVWDVVAEAQRALTTPRHRPHASHFVRSRKTLRCLP